MKKELKKYIKENLTKEKKSYKSHRAFYACIKNLYFDFEEDDYEDEVSEENLNKDEPQESPQENIKNDILQNTEPSIKETKRKIYDYDEFNDFEKFDIPQNDEEYDIDIPPFLQHWKKEEESNRNIKMYLKKQEFSNFQKTLFRMIDERHLKDSDVYNKVHIDRRLFSKIRNDERYHPSKETIILLGFSLELSETEIDELLNSASYSLPKNNYYDLIIRFCFINKIYRIIDVNELLDEYDCDLFNY